MNEKKPKATAVVVNDHPAQLNVLCALLRKTEIEPLPFSGVEAALRAMNPEDPPNLIVTDLYMPGIDGWRFCHLLRSLEYRAFNKIPIMIVSATFAGDHPERIAIDAKADAFLSVPVNGKEFTTLAHALLSGKFTRRLPRVLLVEDDISLARLLQQILANHGYDADITHTIREATEAFDKTAYDVAVIDYYLPDGTGDILLDAFHAQRSSSSDRAEKTECACVLISGDMSPERALDWMRRGAAAYLHKPFSPETLIELCVRARRERTLLRAEDLLEVRTRELRESESRYRGVFAATPDGMWIHAMDGAILDANETLCRRIGLPREMLIGRNISEFIPTQSIEGLDENMQNALEGRPRVFETTCRSTTGTYVEVEVHEVRIPWQGVPAVLSISRDITERKRAEKALRLDEERLQALLMLNNMTHASERELAHFAMEAAVRLTGSTIGYIAFMNEDETLLTMHAWSAHAMDECAIINKPIVYPVAETGLWGEAVRQRKAIITNDYAAPNPWKKGMPEGHVHIIRHMNAPTFEGGRIVIVAGVANKSTDYADDDVRQLSLLMTGLWTIIRHNRAEKELQQTNHLLAAVVEQSPVPMAMVTANDNVVRLINDACLRFLGVPDSDFTGRRLHDLEWNWVDRTPDGTIIPHEEEPIAKALRGEAVHAQLIQLTDCNGNVRWCEAEGVPIRDSAGNVIAGFIIFPDITARKRTEEEKEELQNQFAQVQKMESIGRLAGGVAHDFNNMLQAILGHAELALERVAPNDPLREDLEQIRTSAWHSAALTGQLLAFARKQTIAPKALDLNQTVTGILKILQRLIGEDINLIWKPGAQLGNVLADPSQVNQILTNLCVNARDAIVSSGKITIETDNALLDENYCSQHAGSAPGDYVRLTVSDNGCGVDAEILSHLFEPFFTTKARGKGTGLGLATVYGIVKQNKGFITVNSELNHGSTFTIYLPRHNAKTPPKPERTPISTSAAHGETILLVEDETIILKSVTQMLKELGYTMLSAATPGEAIQLAKEYSGKIDLLMTDVIMPEMNGRDLASTLIATYPAIKLLFMSGYTSDIIAQHGVLDEGVHFIQKPFSKALLAAKISEVLK